MPKGYRSRFALGMDMGGRSNGSSAGYRAIFVDGVCVNFLN